MKMKKADVAVAIYIMAAIIMFIVPIPSWLLDVLLAINISVALTILFATMFSKEVLDMSFFPTMLLFTTIFRIALNTSSTRLILRDGNAGNVVETFGEFVGGGDLVIGVIIFIILILIQFMVINKGSERVSEVTARFTLDAMPGKQMAIDADLNAGIINEEEAKRRRNNIQREADFYGSMDGATKFVKGDAIMSIVTTLVNLIGGVIIGMVRGGGDFNSILNTYSLATVGDGLCSQIPALLISVATGMIVTRAASEDSLVNDIKSQFTAQPFVLMIAGIVMIVMMVIPGFPTVVCLILGVLLILAAFLLNRNKKKMAELELAQRQKAEEKEMEKLPADNDYYRDIDNVFKLLNVEPIEMEFGYSLLRLVDEKSGGNFIERVVIFRKQFALDMGMVIPSVRMTDNPEINPNMYIIKIKGEEVARGEILVDHYLALDSGDVTQQIDGIDTVEPAFGLPAKWISEDKKIMADVAGYTLIDPVSVMITHWSEIMKRYAHELLSRQDVNTMLDNVKKTNPIVVDDTIPKVISVGYLQKILSNLLREGIPIRDLETILETIGDHANVLKDTDIITEYVRQSLKRTITHRFAEANSLRVITLDTQIEDMIVSSVKKSDQGSYLAMAPDLIQRIVAASNQEIDKIKDVIPTVIILTSPVVRIYYKKLTEQFIPNITVLSYSEIDSTAQIQAIGNISLNMPGQRTSPIGQPAAVH